MPTEGQNFSNGEYDIFDALPNNVLYGVDGQLYFIDTIIYPTKNDGLRVYRSLSPRFLEQPVCNVHHGTIGRITDADTHDFRVANAEGGTSVGINQIV